MKPAYERAFVGRTSDLERIEAHFAAGAALVTVTGTAGIGKTALARRFVAAHADLVFCDLTAATDAAAIVGTVARALGLADDAAPMVDALAGRGPTFLVLDNFEQLVEHADATVGTWILQVPELQVLVTSRERLRVPGEVVHELAALSLPHDDSVLESEAARLWLARVREQRADYAPSRAEIGQVARLLRELDGLPLAIELAAARMGTLSAEEITERVERRLDVLAERRGPTLRSAIEGSWRLLDPDERDLLARCSLLRGRIAPAAAEALVDPERRSGTLDRLQALREKSLLTLTDDAGLGMFVSIRKLAADKLEESGRAELARARHNEHFLEYAEACAALGPRDLATAMRRLEAERDNLLEAVRRTVTTDVAVALRILVAIDEPHWSQDGSPVSHLPWFDEALAQPGAAAVDVHVRARALIARGRMAWRAGRFDTSESDVAEAVQLAHAAGDAALQALTLRFSALTFLLRGHLEESERDARRSLALATTLDDPRLRGMAESMLVVLARLRGDQATARAHIERALADFLRVGDLPFELTMRLEQMAVHLDAGELEAARRYAEHAIALHERLGIPRSARLLFGLGVAALEAGHPVQAERHFADAAQAARVAGEVAWDISASACQAISLFEQGRYVEARFEYRELIPHSVRVGRHVYSTLFAAVGAVIEASVGHLTEANELLAEAERGTVHEPHRAGLALCRMFVAGVASDSTSLRADIATLREAIDASATPFLAEARILLRLLERAVNARASAAPDGARMLTLDSDARWFEPPAGARVECGNRPVMRRMLLALAHARLESPPRVLTADDLIEASWPGERIRPDAARNRLHVMLTRVRALGLRDVIEGDDRGYFVSTDVTFATT